MLNNETFFIQPCNIETIDTGFYEHIKDVFNIHTITNEGFVKVPVLWVSPERAFQTKDNFDIRDNVGRLKLPLITIQRSSMQKDPSFKGPIQADIRPPREAGREHRNGSFRVVRKINQEKTSQRQRNIAALERGVNNSAFPSVGSAVVYDEYMIPVPTYVGITYSITLRSEYQQQMNQMVLPFITRTGQVNHFVFKKNNHKFEAFIQQDFSADNNVTNLAEEERKFETKIDIKVLGHLIGEGVNDPRPKIVKKETLVKVHAPIELVLTPTTQDAVGKNIRKIGDKCYIAKSVVTVSEEDKTGFRASEGLLPGESAPESGFVQLDAALSTETIETQCEDE